MASDSGYGCNGVWSRRDIVQTIFRRRGGKEGIMAPGCQAAHPGRTVSSGKPAQDVAVSSPLLSLHQTILATSRDSTGTHAERALQSLLPAAGGRPRDRRTRHLRRLRRHHCKCPPPQLPPLRSRPAARSPLRWATRRAAPSRCAASAAAAVAGPGCARTGWSAMAPPAAGLRVQGMEANAQHAILSLQLPFGLTACPRG